MKKGLNVKNMKETLVNYCGGDQEEFNKIWECFYTMHSLGFITNDEWVRFYNDCCGWSVDGDYLIDWQAGEFGEIIFDFDNGRDGTEYKEYRA